MTANSYASLVRGVLPLFGRIWRDMPWLASINVGLPLLLGALVVPTYAAQKQLIDLFVDGAGRSEWAELLGAALPPLLLFASAELLRVGIAAMQSISESGLRLRATQLLRSAVHERAVGVPLERLDDALYYDRLQRAESAAGEQWLGVLQNAFSLLRFAFELCGLLTVAFMAGPIAGAVLAAAFAASFYIRLESDVVKRRLNRDLTMAGRQADYFRETISKPETIRDMRVCGSSDYLVRKWAAGMERSLVQRGNANRREIRRGILVSLVQIVGLAGTILWLLVRMKSGEATAGTIVIVFQALRQAYGISARAAFPVGKMYIQSAKMVDLAEFLREPPQGGGGAQTTERASTVEKAEKAERAERKGQSAFGGIGNPTVESEVRSGHGGNGTSKAETKERTGQDDDGSPTAGPRERTGQDSGGNPIAEPRERTGQDGGGDNGKVELCDVTYRYGGADEPALRGIRLTLHPGETVALVGENGAGKSTLAKLLLGLYRPTGGRLLWDGTDYRDMEPERLRRSVSAVFQDFVRYETTLRDNVGFGSPESPEVSSLDASIRRALRAAGADKLEHAGEGLDARVGLLSAGGRNLSGGQWQRLGIARAALRDARLLVLDEPTAALDPQHEKELYRSFRELAKGRTVLFVSHRLGWARYADRIVVLRGGRIVEEGSHAALLSADGEYARMFQAQAAWYRG